MPAGSAPTSPLRLFFGLWPDDATRAALLAHAQEWDWPGTARLTRPERLHLTLHFLGEVATGLLPDLQRVQADWPGCELVLDRPTVWPGGIAVLEPGRLPPELAALHARLGEQLLALDVPLDARPFRPHVTLARRAAGARPRSTAEPVPWRCGAAYRLVQSLPGGRGYVPVARFG